jgi:hypothetical protein
MHADDAANDDMMNLIKGISGQGERAMEPALKVNW